MIIHLLSSKCLYHVFFLLSNKPIFFFIEMFSILSLPSPSQKKKKTLGLFSSLPRLVRREGWTHPSLLSSDSFLLLCFSSSFWSFSFGFLFSVGVISGGWVFFSAHTPVPWPRRLVPILTVNVHGPIDTL
jgi:hypothetical protein